MSKPSSRDETVGGAAHADDDLAQRSVVHVERAPPDDAARVDVERVAPMDVIVDHRGEQIVRRGDRVEIAGEMQIDFVHRRDLRASSAGRAALLAEAGAERRLAQADCGAHADPRQTVAEADRGGGLALAGGSRIDRGDEDQFALGASLQRGEEIGVDLGDRAPLQLQRALGDRQLRGDLRRSGPACTRARLRCPTSRGLLGSRFDARSAAQHAVTDRHYATGDRPKARNSRRGGVAHLPSRSSRGGVGGGALRGARASDGAHIGGDVPDP